MRTTLDLPDDLLREIKVRAAREDRTIKDLVTELLRRGLAAEPDRSRTAEARVELPLVRCAHPAHPSEEMTPERIAAVLLAEEGGRGPGA